MECDQGGLEPFLKAVVRQRFIDHIRRLKKSLADSEKIPDRPSGDPSPQEEAIVEDLQWGLLDGENSEGASGWQDRSGDTAKRVRRCADAWR